MSESTVAKNARLALLGRVAAAKPSGGNNRPVDGSYELTCKRIVLKKSAIIVEVRVDVSVDSADSYWRGDKAEWKGEEGAVFRSANKVGSTFGLFFDMTEKENNPGPGNCRAFFNDLLDSHDASEEEYLDALDTMCDPANGNPIRGRRIKAESYRRPIKTGERAKKPFVGFNWTHVPMEDADIDARCAELDAEEKKAA